MDFERFDKLRERHAQEIADYRARVQIATAKVEFAEAMIKQLKQERLNLGGIISAEAAQERNRLNTALLEWGEKLNERKEALATIKGADKETLDKIAKSMNL